MRQALLDTFRGLQLMIADKLDLITWKLKNGEGMDFFFPLWLQITWPTFGLALTIAYVTYFDDPLWAQVVLSLLIFSCGGLIASVAVGVVLICLGAPFYWIWKVITDAHYAGKRHRMQQERFRE